MAVVELYGRRIDGMLCDQVDELRLLSGVLIEEQAELIERMTGDGDLPDGQTE